MVDHVAGAFPGAPVIAVGYSAGSNVLTKYLGEAGADTPIRGAVSVCNGAAAALGSRGEIRPRQRGRGRGALVRSGRLALTAACAPALTTPFLPPTCEQRTTS